MFSEKDILDLDVNLLNESEKRLLIDKFFPRIEAPHKAQLQNVWQSIKTEKVWDSYQGKRAFGEFGPKFRHSPEYLTMMARQYPPSIPKRTVSGFGSWIMSLYLRKESKTALEKGKEVERSIARLARPLEKSNWRLVYRDPLDEKPSPHRISNLTISGEPMLGAPDLVYENIESKELVIVERKSSNHVVPIDGWPNLKAQLWAYGHIDNFQSASSIRLVGEIWGHDGEKIDRTHICSWDLCDPNFYQSNLSLFQLYGGKAHNQPINQGCS